MRMDARRAGDDGDDDEDQTSHAAEHTHGGDEGKRDARMIPVEIGAVRDRVAIVALQFRVTLPDSAPPSFGKNVQDACS